MGILLEAGAAAKNLTESQFGIASVKHRWNLSGTFQQCLPRYLSADQDGGNEREFLNDYFDTPRQLLTAVFLKGYQWPFDPRKVEAQGSSLIDLLVYQETVLKGRRVYLDFMHNPSALMEDGHVTFPGHVAGIQKHDVACLKQTGILALSQIQVLQITGGGDKGVLDIHNRLWTVIRRQGQFASPAIR